MAMGDLSVQSHTNFVQRVLLLVNSCPQSNAWTVKIALVVYNCIADDDDDA